MRGIILPNENDAEYVLFVFILSSSHATLLKPSICESVSGFCVNGMVQTSGSSQMFSLSFCQSV